MKIAVIGTGYVGLVAGACFAESGNDVVCVDKDNAKIRTLRRGKMPIYEPGLEDLVRKNVEAGRLRFTISTAEGVEKSDVIFIAVPTPPLDDGAVDLSFIEKCVFALAQEEAGYRRDTICASLSTKKSHLSEMLKIASAIPRAILFAIGPAPEVGRRRWLAFAETFAIRQDAAERVSGRLADHSQPDTNLRFQVAALVGHAGVENNQPGFGGELGPDHACRSQHRQGGARNPIVTAHSTPIESSLSEVAGLAAVRVSLAHGGICRHVPDSEACSQ